MNLTDGTAVRSPWDTLPGPLVARVEDRLGPRIIGAVNQTGGFTHGVAARLQLADGWWAFAKAWLSIELRGFTPG